MSEQKKKKSLTEELLKDDFFKPPADDSMPALEMEEPVSEPLQEALPEAEPSGPPLFPDEDLPLPEPKSEPLFEPLDEKMPMPSSPELTPMKTFSPKTGAGGIEPGAMKWLGMGAGAGFALAAIIFVVLGLFTNIFQRNEEPKTIAQTPKPTGVMVPVSPAPPTPTVVTPQKAAPSIPMPGQEQEAVPAPKPDQTATPPVPPVTPPQTASKPPEQPAQPPEPKKEPKYTIDVGTYLAGEYKGVMGKIKKLGMEPYTKKSKNSSKAYTVLIDQKFNSDGEAKPMSMKLSLLGKIENKIIAAKDGSKAIIIGKYQTSKEAGEMKAKVEAAGPIFKAKVEEEESVEAAFTVLVGKFSEESEANSAIEKLKSDGHEAKLIDIK